MGISRSRAGHGIGRSWWLLLVALPLQLHQFPTARPNHSRPQQVPPSKRERYLLRPAEDFVSHTGRTGAEKGEGLHFITSPLDPEGIPDTERSAAFSKWRAQLKSARTGHEVWARLELAASRNQVDASVLGAAMQKCGHQRWWTTLLAVYGMVAKEGIKLGNIARNIAMTAMASCLRDRKLSRKALAPRKLEALQLSKDLWEARSAPESELAYNRALSSAWDVCSAVGPEALSWAGAIFRWSENFTFAKNVISYTSWLSLLEHCGKRQQVDNILCQSANWSTVSLNEVTLGNLVNEAAMAQNSSRADQLWSTLVGELGVKPNLICFAAHAKAHLLAGKPDKAIKVLDCMGDWAAVASNYQAIAIYLQALLILCHSAASGPDFKRLSMVLSGAVDVSFAKRGQKVKKEWQEMQSAGRNILSKGAPLTLHQILLHDGAKRWSVMKSWPDYPAGSNYLTLAHPAHETAQLRSTPQRLPTSSKRVTRPLGLGC
ncbi:unnamed protein product [Symbiodinium sp. CCMP2456]|nr:unnamed protein product [Symbiodinium sp. CCMP2456]